MLLLSASSRNAASTWVALFMLHAVGGPDAARFPDRLRRDRSAHPRRAWPAVHQAPSDDRDLATLEPLEIAVLTRGVRHPETRPRERTAPDPIALVELVPPSPDSPWRSRPDRHPGRAGLGTIDPICRIGSGLRAGTLELHQLEAELLDLRLDDPVESIGHDRDRFTTNKKVGRPLPHFDRRPPEGAAYLRQLLKYSWFSRRKRDRGFQGECEPRSGTGATPSPRRRPMNAICSAASPSPRGEPAAMREEAERAAAGAVRGDGHALAARRRAPGPIGDRRVDRSIGAARSAAGCPGSPRVPRGPTS
jgi:hypothetical protein